MKPSHLVVACFILGSFLTFGLIIALSASRAETLPHYLSSNVIASHDSAPAIAFTDNPLVDVVRNDGNGGSGPARQRPTETFAFRSIITPPQLITITLYNLRKSISGSSSQYVVENLADDGSATVIHEFYDNSATPIAWEVDSIPAQESKRYDLTNIASLPDGYSGFAIISSDKPITGWLTTPFFIAGRISDPNKNGIADVTVSASSGTSATTNASGNYTITGLSAGTYTLTPTKSGYTFYPATRTVSVPPDATGQDFSGSLPNIGFRPDPDGYSFSNYGGSFPWGDYDYRYEDLLHMFGQDAVCWTIGSVCLVKPTADLWHIQANWIMNDGHCDGMASTSLRFFKGLDSPTNFQTGANTTHDLQLENVRRHIAYYFVEQLTDPVKAYKYQVRQNTPSAILNQLSLAMSNGAPDPTTLFVRRANQGGHAITPYAIEDHGNGTYWIRVYDNNHPDDANRYVIINTVNDTWTYDLGGMTWSGDADSHSLGIVPISWYAKQPVCPWCDETSTVSVSGVSTSAQIWLTGQGHLLITDKQGRRIGYFADQFVSEIPGAYESVVDGGLGIEMEPIYTLPLSETYTIFLDGQTLTQTATAAVTQFGPGHAVSVDDVMVSPVSLHRLNVAPDGTQLSLQSNDDIEPTLTIALDGASESNQFKVEGADIGIGQIVTLTADLGVSHLVFNNKRTHGGEYNLGVERVGADGKFRFIRAGIIVSSTDSHYVDYGSWDGFGPMTLFVDHGSDGSIDETLELENQLRHIYLPVVLRGH